MRVLKVGRHIISTPLIEILYDIQRTLTNGNLREIKDGTDNIVVTCPSRDHKNGREAHADCNIYIGDKDSVPYGFARCLACGFQASFPKFVGECFGADEAFGKKWLVAKYGKLDQEAIDLGEPIILGKKQKITATKTELPESILDSFQDYCPYLAARNIPRTVCQFLKIKYDNKTRQVIFPIYDYQDKLVMLAQRSVDTKKFYMTKNVEKEVFCLNKIKALQVDKALIVEGPFDCATGWANNVPTIATLGTVSDYQIDLINKSSIKFLYLCMDSDEAGRRFTQYLKDKLRKDILLVDIRLPKGRKDCNELTFMEWEMLIKNYNLPQINF